MIGTQGGADALPRRDDARPLLQPDAMHAVAGAKNIAARDALVALDNIEPLFFPAGARRARKTALARNPSQLRRIADVQMPVGIRRSLPAARDDIEIQLLAAKRFQRARDKAFGAAVGAILLSDDRQA